MLLLSLAMVFSIKRGTKKGHIVNSILATAKFTLVQED